MVARVYAVMTIPRAIYPGYVREDLSGKSEVQNREARFHEELRKRGVDVLANRGEKSEYYEGSLRKIMEALRSVWVNNPGYNLYEFTTGFATLNNPQHADTQTPHMRHKPNRHSPRLEDVEPLDQRAGRLYATTTTPFQEQLQSFGYTLLPSRSLYQDHYASQK